MEICPFFFLRSIKLPSIVINFLLSSTRFKEIDIEKVWGGEDILGTTKPFPRVKNKCFVFCLF